MDLREHLILSSALIGGITFLIGLVVYLRDRQRTLNILFASLSFGLACWAFGQMELLMSQDQQEAMFWLRYLHLGVVFVPVFFVHYGYVLLREKPPSSLILVDYFGALSFCVLLNTPYVFRPVPMIEPSIISYFRGGPLYPLLLTFFVANVGYGVWLVLGQYLRARRYRRRQLGYILVGAGVGLICGGANMGWVLPNMRVPILMPYGNYLVPLCYLLMAYAMLSRHVVDVTVLAVQSLTYAAMYSVVFGAPWWFGSHYHQPLLTRYGESWWFSPFVAFILLASVAPYVGLIVSRKLESRVLTSQRRYQATLKAASMGVTRIFDIRRLLKLIVHVVSRAVRVQHIGIFVINRDEEGYELRASRGPDKLEPGLVVAGDDPVVAYLHETTEPIITDDLRMRVSDPLRLRTPQGDVEQRLSDVLYELDALGAELVVPSFLGETLHGFMVLGEKTSGRMYTDEDMSVFRVLAGQAALAIENALFYEEIQVAQSQLFQSEKLAMMGQLASGMAHEIHNPLTIVSGQAQLCMSRLQKTSDAQMSDEQLVVEREQVTTVLASIINEVHRASDITHRILRHAKPGKASLEEVGLNELLDDVLALVEHEVRLESIQLAKAYDPDLPQIRANIHSMQEVFLNLIMNAIQAMHGEGSLGVSTSVDGRYVQVDIADDGPGLAAERMAKLFDPFFTTRDDGTGLGLFIVQQLIHEHHGFVDVESELGAGTIFRVRIPWIVGDKASTERVA